jgi:hypothetical protein
MAGGTLYDHPVTGIPVSSKSSPALELYTQ